MPRVTLVIALLLTAIFPRADASEPAQAPDTTPAPAGRMDKKNPAYYFRILTIGPMPQVLYLPGATEEAKTEYIPNNAYPSALIKIPANKLKGGTLEIMGSRERFEKGMPIVEKALFKKLSLEPNKLELICFLRLRKGKGYSALRQLSFDISPDKPPACTVLNLTERPVYAVLDPKEQPRVIDPEKTFELPPAGTLAAGAPYLRLAIGDGTKYIRLNLGRLPLKPGGRSMVIVFPVDPASNNNVPADINAFEID